jgi:hypothetical protein
MWKLYTNLYTSIIYLGKKYQVQLFFKEIVLRKEYTGGKKTLLHPCHMLSDNVCKN